MVVTKGGIVSGPALIHRTLESKHVRRSLRAEINVDVLDLLRPILARAIESRRAVRVADTPWSVMARVETRTAPHALVAHLWHGRRDPDPDPDPATAHVRMSVTPAGSPGGLPHLVAAMAGLERLEPHAIAAVVAEAGDLERYLAWAWLDTIEDSEAKS